MSRKRKVLTKLQLKNRVIKDMEQLGTYKPEFDMIINIYVDLLHQYNALTDQFSESNYTITESYTNKAGATNERKTAAYTALEGLRKDVAMYSDKLGLNPKSIKAMKIQEQKKSVLAEALGKISPG